MDAVDFAITGTINKFPVTTARGGGLDEHIWWVGEGKAESNLVSVGFIDSSEQRFTITRSRDRGLQDEAGMVSRLCGANAGASTASVETLMQTSLIRDESIVALSVDLPEQARFAAVRAAIGGLVGPDYSQRTGAILKAATAEKDEQNERIRVAQAKPSEKVQTSALRSKARRVTASRLMKFSRWQPEQIRSSERVTVTQLTFPLLLIMVALLDCRKGIALSVRHSVRLKSLTMRLIRHGHASQHEGKGFVLPQSH